jgi:PKD repeat protein
MPTQTYSIGPGTVTLTFTNGTQTATKMVTVEVATQITVTITNTGSGFTYSIAGLPTPQSGYQCTCPDWNKKSPALPESEYFSEQVTRDWTDSKAGAKGDCWHIISTKLARGEQVPVPTDISSSHPQPKPIKKQNWHQA